MAVRHERDTSYLRKKRDVHYTGDVITDYAVQRGFVSQDALAKAANIKNAWLTIGRIPCTWLI